MKINIVGIGKVTTAISFNLKDKVDIGYIVSRDLTKAKKLSDELGKGIPVTYNDNFKFEDLVLVGLNDSTLPDSVDLIKNFVSEDNTVIHFSGFHPSTIFPKEWNPASMHPNCPVLGKETSFKDVVFGIEGNTKIAKEIVNLLGGKYFEIPSESKVLYHLSAVLMSNFPLALVYLAEKFYKNANLPYEMFLEVMESLLKTTIENVKKNGTLNSITGPIYREDVDIVNVEMEIFCSTFPELCNLFDGFIQIILSMKEEKESESS